MIQKLINHSTVLFLFLITATVLQAQTLKISNKTIIHDSKERNAVKVLIAPEAKSVKKSFKDFMDDKYDIDIEGIGFLKNKDVLYTEPRVISPISTKVMRLYTKVVEEGGQTAMYVFGQLGYNEQITPYEYYTEFGAMKNLTVDFLNELLPDYYKDIVEDQRDAISDLEKDRDDMRKKMSKNKDKIAELQKENEELEQKLVQNKTKLEEGVETLSEKKATLKKVNTKLEKADNNY